MLIRLKSTRDISSNPQFKIYNWKNPVKNKKNYKAFFYKYFNILNPWTKSLNLKHPI